MAKLTEFLGKNRRISARSPRDFRSSLPVACEVEILEERLVLSPGILAIGVGEGNISRVGVFNSENGGLLYEFNPYSDIPLFTGGVRTAVGYVPDNTGAPVFPVVITAPGPGVAIANSPIRVFSAVAGTLSTGQFVNFGQLLGSTDPYPGFPGGINLGAANFNNDGFSEIITGAGEGGGPHVKVISLSGFTTLFDSFVYNAAFTGGVRVAAGDVNGDGIQDLVTAPGPGGGPHIRVLNGLSGVPFAGPAGSFFAYPAGFTGGVYVASGDFNGDRLAEIVTGAGAGGGPNVRIIPLFGIVGLDPNNPQFDFNRATTAFPYDPAFTGGVRVAAAYVNTDVIADLIVARGPGGIADTIVYSGASANVIYSGPSFVNPFVTVGSFPSSGKFNGESLRLAADAKLPTEPASVVEIQDVQIVFDAALTRLQGAGVPQAAIDQLETLEIQVGDLGNTVLGLAHSNGIVIDDNAAGLGYFIDSTPYEDEEYNADGFAIDAEASSRVDLLTVILHELGHHLGLDDLDPATNPHQLMTGTFNSGERRLPSRHAIETLFSGTDLFDHLLAPSLF